MGTSQTDFDHPYYKMLSGKSLKKCYDFFIEDKAKRMKFVSLGEAFDFISAGGGNFVGYDHNSKELTEFAKIWIETQEPRIDFKRIQIGPNHFTYEETGREYFYMWNKFQKGEINLQLPRINYDKCPLDENHKKTLLDTGGKLRCAHQSVSEIKPSFTTLYISEGLGTGMKKYDFLENEPEEPGDYDDNDIWTKNKEEYPGYLIKKAKYDNEKPVEVVDTCYAIINEPETKYLDLETVLERLNCSRDEKDTFHPFSGFTLAEYVKAWFNQPGEKKYWKKGNGIELFKKFKDFVPIGTDD